MQNHLTRVIGLKIAYYRKLRGYTQQELAQRVDVSLSYIGKIECGSLPRCASLPVLLAITETLEISIIELLHDDFVKVNVIK